VNELRGTTNDISGGATAVAHLSLIGGCFILKQLQYVVDRQDLLLPTRPPQQLVRCVTAAAAGWGNQQGTQSGGTAAQQGQRRCRGQFSVYKTSLTTSRIR
jgi:hypothetical protein